MSQNNRSKQNQIMKFVTHSSNYRKIIKKVEENQSILIKDFNFSN